MCLGPLLSLNQATIGLPSGHGLQKGVGLSCRHLSVGVGVHTRCLSELLGAAECYVISSIWDKHALS